HLVDDVEQLLAIADEVDERTILRARGVPIHAVHLRIVETILHRAPAIVEHLRPFGWTIDADANVEVDATPSTTGSGALTCSRSTACACARTRALSCSRS